MDHIYKKKDYPNYLFFTNSYYNFDASKIQNKCI